jgi:exosortase/archaeosortase
VIIAGMSVLFSLFALAAGMDIMSIIMMVVMNLVMAVIAAIVYAVMMGVFGALYAIVYNILAKTVGGIELDLEDKA